MPLTFEAPVARNLSGVGKKTTTKKLKKKKKKRSAKLKYLFVLYFKNGSIYTLLLDQTLDNYFYVLLNETEGLEIHIAIV